FAPTGPQHPAPAGDAPHHGLGTDPGGSAAAGPGAAVRVVVGPPVPVEDSGARYGVPAPRDVGGGGGSGAAWPDPDWPNAAGPPTSTPANTTPSRIRCAAMCPSPSATGAGPPPGSGPPVPLPRLVSAADGAGLDGSSVRTDPAGFNDPDRVWSRPSAEV